jgi:hypothetical protein
VGKSGVWIRYIVFTHLRHRQIDGGFSPLILTMDVTRVNFADVVDDRFLELLKSEFL